MSFDVPRRWRRHGELRLNYTDPALSVLCDDCAHRAGTASSINNSLCATDEGAVAMVTPAATGVASNRERKCADTIDTVLLP